MWTNKNQTKCLKLHWKIELSSKQIVSRLTLVIDQSAVNLRPERKSQSQDNTQGHTLLSVCCTGKMSFCGQKKERRTHLLKLSIEHAAPLQFRDMTAIKYLPQDTNTAIARLNNGLPVLSLRLYSPLLTLSSNGAFIIGITLINFISPLYLDRLATVNKWWKYKKRKYVRKKVANKFETN